jgi:hypothetical protein
MTLTGGHFLTSLVVLSLCASAGATDITLQNDNIAESGTATVSVQGGLVPGEIATAVLSTQAANYPITLKTIKVFVAKQSASAPNSMTVQLYVWNQGAPTVGATTPNPGTALYASPQLSFSAGAFNAWDVSASNLVLSGPCLVGCKVVSTGHIGVPPFDTYQPNNTTDKNGCQNGKDYIWAKSGATFSWANLCAFGATGDWVIHVDATISQNLGQFTNLGGDLAGNFTPTMTGSGSLADGGAFSIDITGLPPSQTGFLFLGFASLFADFKGGSLGPTPDVLIVLPTGSGTLNLPGGMPAGAPGNFSFYLQMWTPDAGGPHGADATNTLQATTPP